jgi:hypothetical protein
MPCILHTRDILLYLHGYLAPRPRFHQHIFTLRHAFRSRPNQQLILTSLRGLILGSSRTNTRSGHNIRNPRQNAVANLIYLVVPILV